MKATIEVKDKQERDAIKRGLEDPSVRAFVVIFGTLQALPNDYVRKRVLTYVMDRIADDDPLVEHVK